MTLIHYTCPVCGLPLRAPKDSTIFCAHKGRSDDKPPARAVES